MSANRIAPDGTPLIAILFAYDHKKDARIIWFKYTMSVRVYETSAGALSHVHSHKLWFTDLYY